VLVRRRAEQPPLASTFVGVMEPYDEKSNVASIRRMELQDAEGKACPDGEVGIEVRLADGRRDLFFAQNIEARAASIPTQAVVERESGASFEGDLCLVRFDAAQRPQRVLFCRGKSLRVGNLLIRAKREDASFEIDLGNQQAPIVTGSADAVEAIEVAGARLWPK
jgi:hypothetical protein